MDGVRREGHVRRQYCPHRRHAPINIPLANMTRWTTARRRLVIWAVSLTAAFAFRLLFGLSSELFSEDDTQIFLLGLRYHATGA